MNTTKLIIRDLHVEMGIGVYDYEQHITQPVLVNVEAEYTPKGDWRNDSFDQVVCYRTQADSIIEMGTKQHINLVETYAEMIAEHLLKISEINNVTVRVEKTKAYDKALAVGVEIRRSR